MIAGLFSQPEWHYYREGITLLVEWAWLWLPLFLSYVFWLVWVPYVQAVFISKQRHVLLEVRFPRELAKSPLAMELALSGLYQTLGEGTWIDRYWKGQMRTWFSFEIVSLGGSVHFFIRTRQAFQHLVEASMYAQYPEVELAEVDDYTNAFHYHGESGDIGLWGCEFLLTKPDPYPIKTYVDYGLDKDPKEEYKIDPLTSMVEFLGSMAPREQMWVQIIVRAHKKEALKKLSLLQKILKLKWSDVTDTWVDEAKSEIETIMKGAAPKEGDASLAVLRLTKGQQEIISALERSISKLGFDVGIRALYLAEKDSFRGSSILGLIGLFRPYNSNHLNGFRLAHPTGVEYPWQNYTLLGLKVPRLKRRMFDAYRRRSYFFPPYRRKPFVLNAEELATIYHPIGGVARTPTLKRIPSKKVEPPPSLPV